MVASVALGLLLAVVGARRSLAAAYLSRTLVRAAGGVGQVTVQSLSPFGIRCGPVWVATDSGRLEVANVWIRYRLLKLLRGELHSIQASGLRLYLPRGRGIQSFPNPPPAALLTAAPWFHCDRIEVRDVLVSAWTAAGPVAVSACVFGAVGTEGDCRFTARLHSDAGRTRVQVSGTLHEGRFAVRLQQQWCEWQIWSAWLRRLEAGTGNVPEWLGGGAAPAVCLEFVGWQPERLLIRLERLQLRTPYARAAGRAEGVAVWRDGQMEPFEFQARLQAVDGGPGSLGPGLVLPTGAVAVEIDGRLTGSDSAAAAVNGRWRLGPAPIELRLPAESRLAATLSGAGRWHRSNTGWELDGDLGLADGIGTGPWNAQCSVGAVEAAELRVRLPAAGGAQAPEQAELRARLRVRGGALNMGTRLRVAEITADVPVRWEAEDDTLHIDADSGAGAATLHVRGVTAGPALRGAAVATLRGSYHNLRIAALWNGESGIPAARFEGRMVLPPAAPELSGSLEVPPFDLRPDESWCRELLGLPADARLAGRLAATGTIQADRAGWQGQNRLVFSDVQLQLQAPALTLAGLSGTIALTNLWPLMSAPHQEVSFAALELGRVRLERGRIQFRLEAQNRVFVEEAAADWCGGRVRTFAVLLEKPLTRAAATVFCEDVSLSQLLELWPDLQAAGEGRLYGQLPLAIERQRLRLGSGFIYNVPGIEGKLRIREPNLLTRDVPKSDPNYERLRQAEQALEDLRFTALRIDVAAIGTETEAPPLSLALAGTATINGAQRPVQLQVNVKGELAEYITIGWQLISLEK